MRRFAAMTVIIVAVIVVGFLPATAFAHVVVTPKEVPVGERTVFSVSVPNEQKASVSSIKLDVPSSVKDVQPNVLGGWVATTDVDADGHTTAITWTGNIPVGQRADLLFKAQAPQKATELDWKVHQTYADGTVVNWDQKPTSDTKDSDSQTSGPYSVTTVVNDSEITGSQRGTSDLSILSIILSVFAVLVSILSLRMRRRTS